MQKQLVKVNKQLEIDQNGKYPAVLVTNDSQNYKLFVCTGFNECDFYDSLNLKVLEFHWTVTGKWVYIKSTEFLNNRMIVNNDTYVTSNGIPVNVDYDENNEPILTDLIGELDFYHASPVGDGVMQMISMGMYRRIQI
jgi:hypothetical protein